MAHDDDRVKDGLSWKDDRIKPCGHHPDSGCTCRQEDYLEGKLEERGYPGYSYTSQQDEITAKADKPSMYNISSLAVADTQGRHICDWCSNPYNPMITHDCYEKRNDIKVGIGVHTCDPDKIMEIESEPAVWVEQLSQNKVSYEIQNIPHEQAMRIIKDILPKVLELYLVKAKDYPAWPDLGVKGEFVEIWRKTHKLKLSIWDGQEMVSEGAMEIAMDQIAHLLLMLDCSERDR